MARRPDREKAEILTEKDLKELRHNLAHLSVTAVRDFYEQAYQDCRLVYSHLPSPKKIQTLVQPRKQNRRRLRQKSIPGFNPSSTPSPLIVT